MANLSTASFISVVVITIALITSILSIAVDRWGQYTWNNPTGQVLKVRFIFTMLPLSSLHLEKPRHFVILCQNV